MRMIRVWLIGVLLVVLGGADMAFAQGVVTRGGALKKRQYQTYAAMTLYVDPTGSDSNPCTAAGTAACLTLQGVWNKLPRIIRHDITVNVAAGSYTSTSRLEGLQWSTTATSGILGSSIFVEGPALVDVTPTTGSATGTITSVTAVGISLPTVTDTAATWTVDDLRGYFLVQTSGASSGQSRPIISNTATTLTVAAWSSGTAPIASVTYAIQRPAATITGEHSFTGFTGVGGILRFSRIEFTSALTTAATLQAQNHTELAAQISLPQCRVLKTAGSFSSVSSNRAQAFSGANIAGVTSAFFYAAATGGQAVSMTDSTSLVGGFFAYSATGSGVTIRANAVPTLMSSPGIVASVGSINATPFQFGGVVSNTSGVPGNVITAICPSGSTAVGMRWQGHGAVNNLASVNCDTGISLSPSFIGLETAPPDLRLRVALTCTNTTTCVAAERGSAVNFAGITPTFTTVTNELQQDGTNYAFSFLSGLPSPQVISNSYGSAFIR